MTALTRYETARKALAEARAVDEVKSIRDKAVAMQTYAAQAKDGQLIAYATDIRMRAEIRAGELLAEMKRNGDRQKPGDASGGNPNGNKELPLPPKLADLGVTKSQSSRWQKLAALSPDEQEGKIAAAKSKAEAAIAPPPKPAAPKSKPVSRGAVKSNGKFLSVSECVDQVRAAVRKVHADNLEELVDALEEYLETLRDRVDEAYAKTDKIAVDKDPFDDESEDQTGGGQFYRGGI